jgi:flagellar hook-basal body complex protein FliE
MALDPLTLAKAAGALASSKKAEAVPVSGTGFSDTLGKLIDGVEHTEAAANTAVSGMLDKTTDVHDAMIALQKAELTFELTMQIRNKFVTAYQEIMRMPV